MYSAVQLAIPVVRFGSVFGLPNQNLAGYLNRNGTMCCAKQIEPPYFGVTSTLKACPDTEWTLKGMQAYMPGKQVMPLE